MAQWAVILGVVSPNGVARRTVPTLTPSKVVFTPWNGMMRELPFVSNLQQLRIQVAKKKGFQITSIVQLSLRTLRTVNPRIHPLGGNQLHNCLPLAAIFRSSSLTTPSSLVSLLIPAYTLSPTDRSDFRHYVLRWLGWQLVRDFRVSRNMRGKSYGPEQLRGMFRKVPPRALIWSSMPCRMLHGASILSKYIKRYLSREKYLARNALLLWTLG